MLEIFVVIKYGEGESITFSDKVCKTLPHIKTSLRFLEQCALF